MPSVYELAQISNASYDYSPNLKGWEQIESNTINLFSVDGFFSAMFQKGNQYVIVFRGTDDFTNDAISDATLSLGFPPQQLGRAKQVVNSALRRINQPNINVTLTGHSLGGGLASLLSAKGHNFPVVTFNAPGMYRAGTLTGFSAAASAYNYLADTNGIRTYINEFKKVLHIRSEGDLVSIGAGRKIIKNTKTLKNPYCPRVEGLNPISIAAQAAAKTLCAHSMEKLLLTINTIPEFKEEIVWS